MFQDPNDDVVRRGIPRELPCKLTEEEFVRISRTRVAREAERDELADDLSREKKKRQDQIDEVDDEVAKMRRELHSGFQERTVKCNEVFRKHDDGTGWIYVLRLDNFEEVERRPATAHETQRYLPSIPESGLLAQARTAQDEDAASANQGGDDVPSDEAPAGASESGDDVPKKKRKGRS